MKVPARTGIGVNNKYLTSDGKPWLPVMGEFHNSPGQYWEEEILNMKAGGIRIVSTYVFWIHQEEVRASSTGPVRAICANFRALRQAPFVCLSAERSLGTRRRGNGLCEARQLLINAKVGHYTGL
jgi:Glycosyl hydrolases family 35